MKTILRQYYRVLGFAADLLIRINKFIADRYVKIWYYLGYSWFDHRFDYLRGVDNIYWLERAFFAMQLIKSQYKVLDVGCGDGSLSGLFYSVRAKSVDALDLDPAAVAHAQKYYSRPNVRFFQSDASRISNLHQKYDIILAFAIIEHFSPSSGHQFLTDIGKMLKRQGIFMGSTPIFKELGGHNPEHANEFTNSSILKKFLTTHFRQVDLHFSQWPGNRLECYFECSSPYVRG